MTNRDSTLPRDVRRRRPGHSTRKPPCATKTPPTTAAPKSPMPSANSPPRAKHRRHPIDIQVDYSVSPRPLESQTSCTQHRKGMALSKRQSNVAGPGAMPPIAEHDEPGVWVGRHRPGGERRIRPAPTRGPVPFGPTQTPEERGPVCSSCARTLAAPAGPRAGR